MNTPPEIKLESVEQALNLAIEHWEWLALTGESVKAYYPPLYDLATKKNITIKSNCWLCEAKKQGLFETCNECPLNNVQPGCCSNGTYERWYYQETTKGNKEYATEMVDLLKRALEEEKKKWKLR